MNRKGLEGMFYKSIFDLDYFTATKILGQMEAVKFTNGQYRYFEMLLLYEQKEFNRVRRGLRGKKLTSAEKELYIMSLAELSLFDEMEQALTGQPAISSYAYAYLNYLLSEKGYSLTREYYVIESEETYFHDKYKWAVSFDLAQLYSLNKERLEMLQNEGATEYIELLQEKITEIINRIRIKDYFVDKIISCVEIKKEINVNDVVCFPLLYLGKQSDSGLPTVYRPFDKLCDIIKYWDFLCTLNADGLELEIIPYINALNQAVENNNKEALRVLTRMYLLTHDEDRYQINDVGVRFSAVLKSIIEKHSPDLIPYIDDHEIDAEIEKTLSPKALVAYRAAVWQYDSAVQNHRGTLDAGMLCLSYMRILELEINEKIIKPLLKFGDEITEVNSANKERFLEEERSKRKSPEELSKMKQTFEKDWECLGKREKGLELGPAYYFFRKFKERKKRYKETIEFIDGIFEKEILTPAGMEALHNGTLAKWINYEIREKYRNPPAHTRYVALSTALECRDYVLDKLIKLNELVAP